MNRIAPSFVRYTALKLQSDIPVAARRAFTLVELLVVVAIVAVLAAIATMRCATFVLDARRTAAEADLRTLRAAFMDSRRGYLRDLSGIPGFSPCHLRTANLLVATNVFGTKILHGGAYGVQTRGIRLDDGADESRCREEGRAVPSAFTHWDERRERGWRGPYANVATGPFPAQDDRRFAGDPTFGERNFFPSLSHLRLPAEFKRAETASIYGFVGEPAVFDPWGNPYVVQIPPPQAFPGVTNVSDETRFRYARIVSAGPDGRLDTPCHGANTTNFWGATGWTERQRRMSRQAGLVDSTNLVARGDDIVLFFSRNDVDEGEDSE